MRFCSLKSCSEGRRGRGRGRTSKRGGKAPIPPRKADPRLGVGKALGRQELTELEASGLFSPQLGAVTLHPAGTCSDALISQTEFMGDYHTAPAKLCCGAGNRYAPVLNPKRPCYICQACPGKAPSVQMLSLLCLHQKI